MITSSEKQQLIRGLIISISLGFVSSLYFMIFDQMEWGLIHILGSFAIAFIPVLLILLYSIFISKRHLKKLHGFLFFVVNSLVYFIIILITFLFTIISFGLSPDYSAGKMKIYEILFHPESKAGLIILAAMVLIVQFYLLLNSFLGRGILFRLFFGTYHKPKEVDRFFMFLDIRSATTIAEKIGHLKFLSLIRDFFFDLDESITETKGELYKYVGDEAIIVWKTKNGISKNNCISCFFNIKDKIRNKERFYIKKYGLVPDFKAGLHFGKVVIGEIGNNKKEITYLGDVLNTTARIEGVCNKLKKDFIISRDVVDLIITEEFNYSLLGSANLRGKQQSTKIYSVDDKR